MKKFFLLVFVVTLVISSKFVIAGCQPRDFITPPPGMTASVLYINHTSSNSMYENGKKIVNADLESLSGMMRFVHYFSIGDYIADVNICLPYANMELNVAGSEFDASGVADPGLVFTFWPISDHDNKRFMGVAAYAFAPLGDYENDGTFSVGENRWHFKSDINFTQGFEIIPDHNLYLELGGGIDLYTVNNDYGPSGDDLKQDPIYNLESHVSFDITKDVFIAADYYGKFGGEKSWGDYDDVDRINTQAVGCTLNYSVTPTMGLMFSYTRDVYVENGLNTQNLLCRIFKVF